MLGGTLMDKQDPAATKDALLEFAGSPAMAMAVSRVANQMLQRGVVDALLHVDRGAVRLPDGRSVRPIGGDAALSVMTFVIGKNAAGEITVAGHEEYTQISRVKDFENRSINVKPGGEMSYTVEITLAADGTFRVSQAPEIRVSSLEPA